ncbi:protein of unknown function [Magnetospira sp. QH-2]|nr:protein of unknown function [Magnetospira sp. QH-2]
MFPESKHESDTRAEDHGPLSSKGEGYLFLREHEINLTFKGGDWGHLPLSQGAAGR